MQKARITEFDRLENSSSMGAGKSVSYETERGETLAYLDYLPSGQVMATVFKPYRGTSREYAPRNPTAASDIVIRHLKKEGYEI